MLLRKRDISRKEIQINKSMKNYTSLNYKRLITFYIMDTTLSFFLGFITMSVAILIVIRLIK